MSDLKRFLVSYRHDGAQWNIEIPAANYDDARQRLSQLAFGRLEGEVIANIPAALGPIAMLAMFARNAMRRHADKVA